MKSNKGASGPMQGWCWGNHVGSAEGAGESMRVALGFRQVHVLAQFC